MALTFNTHRFELSSVVESIQFIMRRINPGWTKPPSIYSPTGEVWFRVYGSAGYRDAFRAYIEAQYEGERRMKCIEVFGGVDVTKANAALLRALLDTYLNEGKDLEPVEDGGMLPEPK